MASVFIPIGTDCHVGMVIFMNLLKRIIGKICLHFRIAAEGYEIETYKKNLAACGKNVQIGRNCRILPEHVYIGDDVVIGESSYLMATRSDIHIGNHVVMAPGVIMRGGGIIVLTL